jgi:hypothetical protein
MLANCRDVWERDYAHLAPRKKKRDAFEEWLYRKKEEDTPGDEFRRYSIAGSAIPATEKFDPIAWWTQPDVEEAFPYPAALGPRYIRLPSNILQM